jgi:putative photosynthetic complex assembly protein 2
MADYGLPALYAMFVWWFTTGAILFLDGLPKRTYGWSMLSVTVLALLALIGLDHSCESATVTGAFCAFTCAIVLWGWVETSFLLGFVTGPRTRASPPGASDGQRFIHAVGAIAYHELAIVGTAALIVALTNGAPNQVGLWTFMILWVMRLSAKLNLFLGVRNLGEEFLPERMRYLHSFFLKRPMNLLFPVSVTAATAFAAILWKEAAAPAASAFDTAGLALAATLLSLAILEHWFMVLPLPTTALWGWGLRSRAAR